MNNCKLSEGLDATKRCLVATKRQHKKTIKNNMKMRTIQTFGIKGA